MSIPYREKDVKTWDQYINDLILKDFPKQPPIEITFDPIKQLRETQEMLAKIEREEARADDARTILLAVALGAVEESRYIPREQILIVEGTVYAHPVTRLKLLYPNSPVWTTRMLGHRELDRDRRRYPRRTS